MQTTIKKKHEFWKNYKGLLYLLSPQPISKRPPALRLHHRDPQRRRHPPVPQRHPRAPSERRAGQRGLVGGGRELPQRARGAHRGPGAEEAGEGDLEDRGERRGVVLFLRELEGVPVWW